MQVELSDLNESLLQDRVREEEFEVVASTAREGNLLLTATKNFWRVIFLRDTWLFANPNQKVRIFLSLIVNIFDTGVKLLGPFALAKAIEMVGDSKDEIEYFGIKFTAAKLIYASAALNLMHRLIPDIKKMLLYNISESISAHFSQRIFDVSLTQAVKVRAELLPTLTVAAGKHLCCVDMETDGLLLSVTESIHPMLLDSIVGITTTCILFSIPAGAILFAYILLSMIFNEVLSFATNLSSKKSEAMFLFNGFIQHFYKIMRESETVFLFKRMQLESRHSMDIYAKYNATKRSITLRERCWSLQAILTCSIQFLAAFYVTRNNFDDLDLDHIIFLFSYVANIANNVDIINTSYRSALNSINSMREIENFFTQNQVASVLNNSSQEGFSKNLGSGVEDESAVIAIQFKDVSFSYVENKLLFNSISFSIPKGSTVALVGESNCGKTTLTKLLLGLLTPNHGEINFFGQNINQISSDKLRDLISVVSQKDDGGIFEEDSMKYNVLYGYGDDNTLYRMKHSEYGLFGVSLERQIQKVASLTKLTGNINNPQCYGLSGGEKQRLKIARILQRPAKIVIFDEPTSQLDSRIEAEILKNIKKLFHGRTVIMIAHRLSTIKQADMILVLKNNGTTGTEIIEQGKHDDLIKLGGEYAELWELQTQGMQDEQSDAKQTANFSDFKM